MMNFIMFQLMLLEFWYAEWLFCLEIYLSFCHGPVFMVSLNEL
jgi:hypothetical protein